MLDLTIGLALFLTSYGAAAAESGAVHGTVKFEGAAPKMKRLKMSAEASCHTHHETSGNRPRDEVVVVNANGTLRNVFVHVTKGLPEGKTFPTPTEPVVLDQVGCMFRPRVFGVMPGQTLRVLNSDMGVLHNVHSFPEKSSNSFNKATPGVAGIKLDETFKEPEKAIRIKCDVHGWMTCYAHVVTNPFHATTGDDGTFRITGLPPGEYEIEAWHEHYPARTAKVSVTSGGAAVMDFTFQGEPQPSASPSVAAPEGER